MLQEDLAALLKENSECKQDVASNLIEKFFPNIIVPNEENKLTKSEAIKKAKEKVKWLSAYRKEDIGQVAFLSDFPFCLKRDLFDNGSELAKTYKENFFNKEDKERREKAIENTHFYIDSVVQGEIREARSKGWNLLPCNLNLNTDDIFITVRVKEKPNHGGTFIFRKEKDHLKMVSCDFW